MSSPLSLKIPNYRRIPSTVAELMPLLRYVMLVLRFACKALFWNVASWQETPCDIVKQE